MFYGAQSRPFLRCVSVFVCMTFLPISVQADNFTPPAKPKPVQVPAAQDGPPLLDAEQLKALENLPASSTPLRLAAAETPAAGSMALSALPSHTLPASPRPAGLSALSADELHQAITARTPRVASHAKALPDAKLLLAQLNQEEPATPDSATVTGDSPIVTDAAGTAPAATPESLPTQTREQRGPAGPAEALSALNAAEAHQKAGRLPEALDGYFSIMDRYPSTNEALWADQGMWDVLEGLDKGTLHRADVAGFEEALASRAFQSGDGQYAALTYASERALAEDKHGNKEAALSYARAAMPDAWDMLRNFPDHYLSMSAADYLWEMLCLQDHDTARASAEELRAFAEELKPCPARLGAYYALTRHFARPGFEAMGDKLAACAEVDKEIARPYIETLLKNEAVPYWAKAEICVQAGWSLMQQVRYEEARAWYERGEQLATRVGPMRYYLGFMAAQLTGLLDPMSPETGVGALQTYLAKYPKTTFMAQVLTKMGGLYALTGDYADAERIYLEAVERATDPTDLTVAQQELQYIQENLAQSEQELAQAQPEPQDKPLCGPLALRELLERMGVSADTEELAKLAGTDEAGSTMQGLIDAAKAKGVVLTGVRAASPETLPLPAIAFVNAKHFVVVTAVRTEGVDIVDPALGSATIDRAGFFRQWAGQALVTKAEGALKLSQAALASFKGGNGGSINYQGQEPPCTSCDCPPSNGGPGSNGPGINAPGINGPGPGGHFPSPVCCTYPCPAGPRPDPREDTRKSPNSSSSPTAKLNVTAPGVHPVINNFETTLRLDETDLSVPVRAAFPLAFKRNYRNPKGFHRGVFSSTGNVIGESWTHNYNTWLSVSSGTPPSTVTFYDEQGIPRVYAYTSSDTTYYLYSSSWGLSEERANVLKRHKTAGTYVMSFGGGNTYEFSAADASGKCRLLSMKDASANETTLSYDGGGAGKLTKITGPAGDAQNIALSYDASSRITKAQLKANSTVLNEMSYAYNANGELNYAAYYDGSTVNYSYASNASVSGSRAITKITDKLGRDLSLSWTYALNASSQYEANEVDVTNAEGLATSFARSISTGICTTINWNGTTMLSKFVNTPVTGNFSLSLYKDYYTSATTYLRMSYQYDSYGALTKMLYPNGSTAQKYVYNSMGRMVTKQVGDTGPIFTWQYDASGLYATKQTEPTGPAFHWYYDANHRVTRMTHPSLTHTPVQSTDGVFYAYDANGLLTQQTGSTGDHSLYAYDSLGRMTQTTSPEGNVNQLFYDDEGRVVTKRDALNQDTYLEYASSSCGCGNSGKMTKMSNASGESTYFDYDDNGQMLTMSDALNRATTYAYDAIGRMTQTVGPDGAVSTMEYDLLDRLTKQTDADGRQSTMAYDFLGQMTQQTDAVGSVSYTYTSLGKVSTVSDGLGHATTNSYDTLGHLTKTTDAIGKVTNYYYDAYYRQTKVGAASGGTFCPTTYYFDPNTNRMTRASFSGNGTEDTYYRYDYAGRLTQVDGIENAAPGGSSNPGHFFERDKDGRMTKYRDYDDDPNGTRRMLQYSYDANGRAVTMRDYDGYDTTYTYTATGQVSTITAPGAKVWDYDYNALGQPTQVTMPNGMTTEYGYDGANRMTKLEHKDGATVKLGFTYGITPGGQITKITHQDGAYWAYENDGRGRLTKAERYDSLNALQLRETCSYDAGDNLLTKIQYDQRPAPAVTKTSWFRYDNANELTKLTENGTDTNMTYDDWGRLVTKTQGAYQAVYQYNYGQFLHRVDTNFPGETSTSFQTDALGKRRAKTVMPDVNNPATWTTMTYRWNLAYDVMGEYGAGSDATTDWDLGTRTKTLVQVSMTTLAEIDGTDPSSGTARYYAHDHLGSARGLYGSDNSELGTTEHNPYGDIYASTGTPPVNSFTGKAYDVTVAMYYFPYRYYSPQFDRWATRDPLGMVDGPNLYGYVGNNVQNHTDALGDRPDGGIWGAGHIKLDESCKGLKGFYTVEDRRDEGKGWEWVPLTETGKTRILDFYCGPKVGTWKVRNYMWCTVKCKAAKDDCDSPTIDDIKCIGFRMRRQVDEKEDGLKPEKIPQSCKE